MGNENETILKICHGAHYTHCRPNYNSGSVQTPFKLP